MRNIQTLAFLAAASLFLGSAANALEDPDGTYEGTMTCRSLAIQFPQKIKQDITIVMNSGKGGFAMSISGEEGTIASPIGGLLGNEMAHPEKGKLGGVQCSLAWGNYNGSTVEADITVKPGGAKASMKGTLIRLLENPGLISLCTFSAKRTSTEPVIVPFCT